MNLCTTLRLRLTLRAICTLRKSWGCQSWEQRFNFSPTTVRPCWSRSISSERKRRFGRWATSIGGWKTWRCDYSITQDMTPIFSRSCPRCRNAKSSMLRNKLIRRIKISILIYQLIKSSTGKYSHRLPRLFHPRIKRNTKIFSSQSS